MSAVYLFLPPVPMVLLARRLSRSRARLDGSDHIMTVVMSLLGISRLKNLRPQPHTALGVVAGSEDTGRICRWPKNVRCWREDASGACRI